MNHNRNILVVALFVLLISPGAFADSRLQVLFSLSAATGSLQDIDYTKKGDNLKTETGSGILFDWAMRTPDSILSGGLSNHAVGIDYYALKEEENEQAISATNLFLGYRYHFLSRFYVGASVALVSEIEVEQGKTATGTPLAYTLGYTHVFPFSLTLGVHIFRSLNEDYEFDDGSELEDVEQSLIGLTLGFDF